ncbi:MAG: ABC transporter permease [Ruminococcus sp.]|nr:ABC transporter permease [Ruminococcus sp.]
MRYAWKEIAFGKKKYILIELLLILLMFMVLFLAGLAEGLGRAVSSAIETMDADSFIVDDSAEQLITVSTVDAQLLEDLRAQGADAAPLDIQRMYIRKQDDDKKLNVTYFAIEQGSFIEPEVIEGEGLSGDDAEDPILLDDDYRLEGIEVGDTVVDPSSEMEFTVAGFVKDRMYGHTSVGYITVDSYTKLRTALDPMYAPAYHAIAVRGDVSYDFSSNGLELVSRQEIIENIPSYTAEHMTITMIVWVLVVVSAVIIGIFNYILTLQKRKQYGVMKAIGIGSGELAGMVVSEVCIISVFAAAVALGLTFAMSAALPETMPFYLEVPRALAVTAAFVLISVLSSLLSVINISRIDPMIAIGGGDE